MHFTRPLKTIGDEERTQPLGACASDQTTVNRDASMEVETTAAPTIGPLLTLRQTAATLRISEVTLRRLVKAGTGPKARRIGKGLRFRAEDVRDYVAAH